MYLISKSVNNKLIKQQNSCFLAYFDQFLSYGSFDYCIDN